MTIISYGQPLYKCMSALQQAEKDLGISVELIDLQDGISLGQGDGVQERAENGTVHGSSRVDDQRRGRSRGCRRHSGGL